MSMLAANPVRVLLVEDNPGDVLLTQEAMADADMRTTMTVVGDGKRALDYLAGRGAYAGRDEPQLIILDLNLPGVDGHQVLAAIKQQDRWSKTPVLIFSSSRDEAEILRCYTAHANSYVSKPGNLDDFATAVRHIHDFWLQTARLPSS